MKNLLSKHKIITYSCIGLLLLAIILFCFSKYSKVVHRQPDNIKLPYNLSLEYWGYDVGNLGFVITNENDFIVIGKGNKKYFGSGDSIYISTIKTIIFNDEYLKVEVLDSNNVCHYIYFDEEYFAVDNCNDFIPTSTINIVDNSYYSLQEKTSSKIE